MKNLKYIILIIALVISINPTSAQIGNNNSEVECDVTPVKTLITKIPVTPTIPNLNPPTDTDGDGLPDSEEFDGDCPDMFNPDSDGDGILDGEDECPCNPDPNCEEEIRKIFFVHGYTPTNGSTAWSRVQTWTQATYDNVQTHNFNYSSLQLSLDQAANAVRQEIEAVIPDLHNPNKNNFVIAHSLGGMVMRNIESFFSLPSKIPYDGVISFGVGHKGAYASETYVEREHLFINTINYTCSHLLAPFLIETVGPHITYLAGGLGIFDDEKFCDQVDEPIFNLIEKLQDNGIGGELTPTAAQSWESGTTNHNVALYGIEEDDDVEVTITKNGVSEEVTVNGTLTPRFFGAMKYPPKDADLFSAEESDDVGLKLFAENIIHFENKKAKHNKKKKWRPGSLALNIYNNIVHGDAENTYKKGLRWFTQINYLWKEIIGGIQNIQVQTDQCECLVTGNNPIGIPEMVTYPGDCNDLIGSYYEDCFKIYDIQMETHLSDGFILTESAMAMPNPSVRPILMYGSNHFQMRNDKNTEAELNFIFDGGLGLGYFYLPR